MEEQVSNIYILASIDCTHDNANILQPGHSEKTAARNYAHIEYDFSSFNTGTIERFLRVSLEWHKHLGVDLSIHETPVALTRIQRKMPFSGQGNEHPAAKLNTIPVQTGRAKEQAPHTEKGTGRKFLREERMSANIPVKRILFEVNSAGKKRRKLEDVANHGHPGYTLEEKAVLPYFQELISSSTIARF